MKEDINLYEGLPNIDKGTVRVVNYIFDRLAGIIPSMDYSASNHVGMDARKREYTYQLMQDNINNMSVINRAIEKIRKAGIKFLPSPAEFVKFCNPSPEDVGAPDVETAYNEAALHAHPQSWTKDWTHPAVKHAYKITGPNSFLNPKSPADVEKLYSKFEANYMQACLDYAAGKIMDQIENKREPNDFQINKIVYSKEEWKPGNVLEQYRNISTAEECFAVLEKITGKGTSRLKNLIHNLENRYKEQHGEG